jgi:hypothetical protein
MSALANPEVGRLVVLLLSMISLSYRADNEPTTVTDTDTTTTEGTKPAYVRNWIATITSLGKAAHQKPIADSY